MARKRGLIESARDRRALAADAGFGSLSIGSVLAGVLVAYGAFAVLVGVAAAIVDALNVDTDITTNYEQLGIVGGLIVAGILLVSYLSGGYVAGRMARRAGVLNGLLVAVLGLAIAAAVAALVRNTDAETINSNLRSLGVPTTADEYGQAFTVAGLASMAAIFIGSLLGGSLGERWHGKLLARAANPAIGTEADARKRAASDMAKAEEERTLAFDRARTSNPARARRVDRDALRPPTGVCSTTTTTTGTGSTRSTGRTGRTGPSASNGPTWRRRRWLPSGATAASATTGPATPIGSSPAGPSTRTRWSPTGPAPPTPSSRTPEPPPPGTRTRPRPTPVATVPSAAAPTATTANP